MLTPTVRAIAWHRARRRWVTLTALALLCALGATIAITTLAAARRSSTAVDRALDGSGVADISVDVAVADDATLDRVRALPEVREVSAFQFVAVRPSGTDLVPGIDVVGILPVVESSGRSMDVPRIHRGRLPAPQRADEVALSPGLARRLGAGIGDDVRIEAYGQDQVEAIFAEGGVEPAGAVIDAVLVGIAEPMESVRSEGDDQFGVVMLSHAIWRTHGVADAREAAGADVGIFRMLLRARLRDGAEGPAFLRGVFDIYGELADTTFSEARPDVFDNISHATRVEAVALLLFGVIASLAVVLGVGQALARETTLELIDDERTLRAIGMRRRELVTAASVPAVSAVLAGSIVAVIGAWAAAAWIPGSAARAIDPDDGLRFDPAVVLPGALVLVVLLAARAVGAAWSATRPNARHGPAPSRPLPLGVRTPSASLGVGLAGRGRPAVTASIVAVVGVVAALVFSASLHRLSTTPRLHGDDWDLHVLFQTDGATLTRAERPALLADERIEEVSQYARFELTLGDDRVAGIALHQLEGVTGPGVVAGRLPVADDEIALDVGALDGPRPGIDEQVSVSASSGRPRTMTVVGLLTGTGSAGFVVTDGAADRLGAEASDQGFFLRVGPDADPDAVADDLRQRLVEVERPEVHPRVANLASVDEYPSWVAALLVVLGVGTAGHLLHAGVRRERHQLAVLKALGFTRRQVRRVVAWQAGALGLLAIVGGVPLGIWGGRFLWSAVAGAVRVVDAPATPVAALVAVVVGSLVVAQVLAALPARSAARTDAAEALRTE